MTWLGLGGIVNEIEEQMEGYQMISTSLDSNEQKLNNSTTKKSLKLTKNQLSPITLLQNKERIPKSNEKNHSNKKQLRSSSEKKLKFDPFEDNVDDIKFEIKSELTSIITQTQTQSSEIVAWNEKKELPNQVIFLNTLLHSYYFPKIL